MARQQLEELPLPAGGCGPRRARLRLSGARDARGLPCPRRRTDTRRFLPAPRDPKRSRATCAPATPRSLTPCACRHAPTARGPGQAGTYQGSSLPAARGERPARVRCIQRARASHDQPRSAPAIFAPPTAASPFSGRTSGGTTPAANRRVEVAAEDLDPCHRQQQAARLGPYYHGPFGIISSFPKRAVVLGSAGAGTRAVNASLHSRRRRPEAMRAAWGKLRSRFPALLLACCRSRGRYFVLRSRGRCRGRRSAGCGYPLRARAGRQRGPGCAR